MSTAPREIGSYRILREIGRGGMGVVYEAEPLACPGARYALKLLVAQDARARERFRREADLLARVDGNRNVVRVHAVSEDKGRPFLVLDLVEGESLESLLARGPLPWPRALELMEQVADGLAAVHERGILHRDLKPANILVDRDGIPRLTDFGISFADDLAPLTQTGNLVGTVDYLAPERLRGGRELDPRSDLWSFGASLYEALTAERPYAAPTIIDRMRLVDTEKPRPPSARVPGIPAAVDRFVLRLLAKDPAERPASARACARELVALRRSANGCGVPLLLAVLVLVVSVAILAFLAAGRPTAEHPRPDLAPLEDELRRVSADAIRPEDVLRRVEAFLATARARADARSPEVVDLIRRGERIQATVRGGIAHPSSATSAAAVALARARAARGTDNPAAYTAIDDPSSLVRHADQVADFLAEARAADPSIEVPVDLVDFVTGAGRACGRHLETREAVRVLERAVLADPGHPEARLEAAYYEIAGDGGGPPRALVNANAVLGGNRASPDQREHAFQLAVNAASRAGDTTQARALVVRGLGEFPDSLVLLMSLAEEQVTSLDPGALETTRRLIEDSRPNPDTKIIIFILRARACVDIAKDGRGALDALKEIHGPRDWTATDPAGEIRLAVSALVLLKDPKEARRLLAVARAATEREGAPASDNDEVERLVAAASE